MLDQLKGKRTYIIMGIIFILGGLKGLGIIDDAVFEPLVTILAPAGVMALRAGMK